MTHTLYTLSFSLGKSEEEDLPDPIELPSKNVIALRGEMTHSDGKTVLSGQWAMEGREFTKRRPCTEAFSYVNEQCSANDYSGDYVGGFKYGGTDVVDYDLALSFVPNNRGNHNVTGSGVNDFGSFHIKGILYQDGGVDMCRTYHTDLLTTQLPLQGGCSNCIKHQQQENADPNNDCLCCFTPPQQPVQPGVSTSEIHPVAARGIETLRNSEYYDMKGAHPHAKGEYYLHRILFDYIIFILAQLNESTTHIVLSLLLCVTMESMYTVEGFTNFASKEDMLTNVSALAFAIISDFFALIPGNVDYGNNLAMFGYNSRLYCLLQMVLDKKTQEWIESKYCLPWTKEEAEARIFAIKVLVDVCDKLGIPVLHLNFGGGGTKAATEELKKINSKLFFRVDITSHLATFTNHYMVFGNKVKQQVNLTTKAETMNVPIDQFLKVVLSRMHRLDSSCTLEMPELSFSDMLKNNECIKYVCHWDDEMTSTRADMERVKEKKQEQKRLMELAASIVFKQCKVDWTQKNPKVTSEDTSTPRYADDIIQHRSSWTTTFPLHEKRLSKKKVIVVDRDLINSDPNALANIESPGPNDVMIGRGGGTNNHPGNVEFRRTLEVFKPFYKATTSKTEKRTITTKIVIKWRALDPPGRFLKKNETTGLWDDIGDAQAYKKCATKLAEKDTVQETESKKRKAAEVEPVSIKKPMDSVGASANLLQKQIEFNAATTLHSHAVCNLLIASAARGESSVDVDTISVCRNKTLAAMRRVNLQCLPESELMKRVGEAEQIATQLYIQQKQMTRWL